MLPISYNYFLPLTKIFEICPDEGLTLETSAFLLFTVADLRFQPSC